MPDIAPAPVPVVSPPPGQNPPSPDVAAQLGLLLSSACVEGKLRQGRVLLSREQQILLQPWLIGTSVVLYSKGDYEARPLLKRSGKAGDRAWVEFNSGPGDAALPQTLSQILVETYHRGARDLLSRTWDRWGETVTAATGDLAVAMSFSGRFADFRGQHLEPAVQAIRDALGLEIGLDYEREGRGGKVVRVLLSVGQPPAWMAARAPAEQATMPSPRELLKVPVLGPRARHRMFFLLSVLTGNYISVEQSIDLVWKHTRDAADGTMDAEIAGVMAAASLRLSHAGPGEPKLSFALREQLFPLEAVMVRCAEVAESVTRVLGDLAVPPREETFPGLDGIRVRALRMASRLLDMGMSASWIAAQAMQARGESDIRTEVLTAETLADIGYSIASRGTEGHPGRPAFSCFEPRVAADVKLFLNLDGPMGNLGRLADAIEREQALSA